MRFLSPICFFVFIACLVSSHAQVFNGFNTSTAYITAHFRQESMIIQPETSFFNVLIIENKGQTQQEFRVVLNAPLGWSIMADDNQNYNLQPGDSLLIPVRAAPSKGVEGEIGYSLIAAVNNRSGETLTNAYCFIKIPRQTDFHFRPLTRISYFDQQTGEAEIAIQLLNRGNVNELVYLNFQSMNQVQVGNEKDNQLRLDFLIKARSDTIIRIPARMVNGNGTEASHVYRVDLTVLTEQSSHNTFFWFSHLSNHYHYRIAEYEKILIAEFAAQNLLSQQEAIYNGGVRGNILFNRQRDLNYGIYVFGTRVREDFLKYSRLRVSYNTPRTSTTFGDINNIPLKYGGGKGGEFTYRTNNQLSFTTVANQNSFRPIRNYGVSFEEKQSIFNFNTRFFYTENQFLDNQAYLVGARGNIRLLPGHTVRMDLSFSDVNYNLTGNNAPGYGFNLGYTGRINNTSIRINEQFGSETFYGSYSGRHNLSARLTHPFPNNYLLDLNFTDYIYKPTLETREGIISSQFIENRRFSPLIRKTIDRNYTVIAGPVYERKSTNSFLLYDGINPFTTQSARINAGMRINDGQGFTISPSITFGYSFVTRYSDTNPETYSFDPTRNNKFFNSQMSINMRKGYWGAYFNYFYGPYSINQELSQFYYNITANSVRLMPYLERFIYRDKVRLISRLNFLHDFSFKTTRYNINSQMDLYLKNDITISLLNTFSHQATTDLLTENIYKYSNNYVEVRVLKEFNWNQPRIKYYDLTLNLYKDLNGNLRRDFNEPGVKDILVSITSIDPILYSQYNVDYEPAGNMVAIRLLTGMDGTVTYENLPRGFYKIELQNIGRDQDKYFPDQSEFIIHVKSDQTEFIPYLERNKIFGRVIMNRSKLSNLGRIEVSNIKVTATDSKDRSISTLTDANGYYEMYVPSVDSYIVSINNIFQEHFNLRQNNFRANLNGFKQFEVTFVFDEIRRHIEFTPSIAPIETEIRRVGRTNLSGIVRDASTLQNLRAQIEVINTDNNSTIARTNSDRATGKYNTSFATANNYSLVVSAPGYWLYSERLSLDSYLTIQDVERDILLESITIGARFELPSLRFASERTEIPLEAIPEIDRLIDQLKNNPNVRIRISGHSDAIETLIDRAISQRRAETLMRYMVQNGLSNIEYTGLEDTQPSAPNDTEENRRRNRRIDILIVDK